MGDYYAIEGNVSIHAQPSAPTWRLQGKADTMVEARKLAVRAIENTNYLNIRIRKVWVTQPDPLTNQE